MPGVTTRIKSITTILIENVNRGHKFTADELGAIVENLVELKPEICKDVAEAGPKLCELS